MLLSLLWKTAISAILHPGILCGIRVRLAVARIFKNILKRLLVDINYYPLKCLHLNCYHLG